MPTYTDYDGTTKYYESPEETEAWLLACEHDCRPITWSDPYDLYTLQTFGHYPSNEEA